MTEIGSIIRAPVVEARPYGIYFQHGEEKVIVLAREVFWIAQGDLRKRIHIGDVFDILVLGYNYQKQEIIGSIRRLHPEENPYRQLSRLPPLAVLQGKVVAVYRSHTNVRLANGAHGHLAHDHLPCSGYEQPQLRPGDDIHVTIRALEVEEGTLSVSLVPPADRA
jgi:ribosomal protein S1